MLVLLCEEEEEDGRRHGPTRKRNYREAPYFSVTATPNYGITALKGSHTIPEDTLHSTSICKTMGFFAGNPVVIPTEFVNVLQWLQTAVLSCKEDEIISAYCARVELVIKRGPAYFETHSAQQVIHGNRKRRAPTRFGECQ